MGYKNDTIANTLQKIEQGLIILPAIQRNYVWNEQQIFSLFDSLLKRYPIGSMLFWNITDAELDEFVFNRFLKDIDKTEALLRGEEVTATSGNYVGVLDGQQRLTSLLIGLRGSYTVNVPKSQKVDGKNPKRYLALNLFKEVVDASEEDYEFAFLTEDQFCDPEGGKYWFRISNILEMDSKEVWGFAGRNLSLLDKGVSKEQLELAGEILGNLYLAIREEDIISYYEADQRKLPEVVEIFERINNNGQPLKGADLMLSMATASTGNDMQKMIKDAMDLIASVTNPDTGFAPDRDFMLTAALYLTDADSISTVKKDNYRPKVIKRINESWEDIVEAISSTAVYVDKLGFNGRRLKKTYYLPLVYYFFSTKRDGAKWYASSTSEASYDRKAIVQWMLRAMVKKIFVDGSGKTLLGIREVMKGSLSEQHCPTFPLEELRANASNRRSLELTEDDVWSILEYKFSDLTVLPLLTALLDMSAGESYDVDHLWPQAKMSTERKILKEDDSLSTKQAHFFKQSYNKLPNLQLLKNTVNKEKTDDAFDVWVAKVYPNETDRINYFKQSLIPAEISLEFGNFEEFYRCREKLLFDRIVQYFDVKKRMSE